MSTADSAGTADVWAALDATLDRAAQRPRLADDIEVRSIEVAGGGTHVMLGNPRTMVYYRLPPEQARVLPLLDGTRTVGDVIVEHLRGEGSLSADAVTELVALLESSSFLADPYTDVYAALDKALERRTLRARAARFMQTLTVEWRGADAVVRRLYDGGLRAFFTRPGLLVGTVVAVAGLAAFVDVASTRHYELGNRGPGPAFAALLVLDLLIIAIHELGHAAALVHYGRRVKSAGFRIYFGSPSFFIESSDALMLSRGRRVVQGLAGPWAEWVAGGVAAIALWLFPDGPAARTLFQFTAVNYFLLLLNLVPFLELDGYWVMSDLLRRPDLRVQSLSFVRRELPHRLRHRQPLTAEEWGLTAYAVLGGAFTALCVASAWFFWRRLFGDTVLAMWRAGAGGKVLVLVLAAFVGGPALRALADGARALGAAVAGRVAAVRFRMESAWRVEAAELFDRSALFGDLPVDLLNDLAGRVRLRPFAPGQAVVRQGERADAYYMVRRGRLEVVEEPVAGAGLPGRVLRVIGPGQGFGEAALLEASTRTATVRAVARSQVFEIDKGTFDRLLADRAEAPHFALSLQQAVQLQQLPPFSGLGVETLFSLSEHGQWLNVQPGDELFRQGEPGTDFYVVVSGQLDIIEDGRLVNTCGAGDHIGELALLFDQPRTATVRAATPARLYRLDGEGFDAVVAAQFQRGSLAVHARADRTQEH